MIGVEKYERVGEGRETESVLGILGSQSEIYHWDPQAANDMILADHGSQYILQFTLWMI